MSDAHATFVPSSEHELSTFLREASALPAARARRCRIVGGGTWLHGGAPVHATTMLHTRALRGVVEYVPGDLVLTVGAGTTLAEIAETTAAYDQWLALDPYLSASTGDAAGDVTIGATIATASQGPLSLGYGRPRDLVLGMSLVTGDGMQIRAGGRVVKNVAGFDLVRLNTGAWGSLGVITQVSVRLHARPPVDDTVAIQLDLPTDGAARHAAMHRLAVQLNSAPMLATTSSLAALAIVCGNASDGGTRLLARLHGNAARVHAQRQALSALGGLTEAPTQVWSRLQTSLQGTAVFRCVDAPSRTADTLRHVEQWLARVGATGTTVIIEPMRGAVRVACTPPFAPATPPPTHHLLPPHAIAEQLPQTWWPVAARSATDALSQQLRVRCDPAAILNAGIVGHPAPYHAP
jgi:glycolate oxidase FAD binding subunit